MIPNSLLCVSLSVVFIEHVVGSLLDKCPRQYTIERTHSDKQIIINVLKKRTVCEKITHDETYEMISNDDLLPRKSVIKKDGDYYLSFSWRARVVDGKFPKMFLLFLGYSIPENNVTDQFECVVLKLQRRMAVENETSSYISFDCIKLFDLPRDKAGTVSIQIWNFSHKQYNGGCRNRRALSHSNTCRTVECSSERHFSLSRELYETEFCSCYELNYGSPNVTSEPILSENTIDFRGIVKNLPDFLVILNLTIMRDNVIVWYSDYDSTELFQNGSADFFTDGLRRTAGNYTMTVFLRCIYNPRTHFYTKSGCRIGNSNVHFLYADSLSEVLFDWRTAFNLTALLFILLVTAAVTVVVFVCYKKRQPMDKANSSRSPTVFDSSSGKTAQNAELSVLLPETIEMNQDDKPSQSVLLLCHHFDLDPALKRVLLTLNIKVEDGRNQNWRQFATNAMSNNYNILILLSKGLLDLLDEQGSESGARLVERHYENVPGVVLKDLEALIKSDPTYTGNYIHVVTPNCDEGNELARRFLEKCGFIKSMSNFCTYFISEDSRLTESNNNDMVRLKNNLRFGQSSTMDTNL